MKIVCFFAFVVLICGTASACDFPPGLWCSSQEISRLCKVEQQCAEHHTHSPQGTAQLVNFTLYYESLCPDCKNFFRTQLDKAYKSVRSIMNLQLVPYGNAFERKEGSKYIFECQHGKQECIGNLIETCAIYLLKTADVFFPFVSCMEASDENPRTAAQKCAKQTGVSFNKIDQCANGTLGNLLEHQMAILTDKLDPPHQYVPWVTLNGVHTEAMEKKAENDLIGLICDAYKGTKPPACGSHAKVGGCTRKKPMKYTSATRLFDLFENRL